MKDAVANLKSKIEGLETKNIGLKFDNERYKDNIEKSNDNDTIRKFVVSYVKKLYNKTKLYLSNLIEII